MSALVLDASATAPLFLDDEVGDVLPGLSEVISRQGAFVPAHWLVEVANLVRVAGQRGRLDEQAQADAAALVQCMPVVAEAADSTGLFGPVWNLAARHGLTLYDAAYLELAMRRGLPLATNDKALIGAANSAGVALFGR